MTTAKDCKSSADFLNLLQEKIAPWFSYKIIHASPHLVVLELGANKVKVTAAGRADWMLCDYSAVENTTIDRNLIRHINGVLAGAVRDDFGKLQPPKEPQSAVS